MIYKDFHGKQLSALGLGCMRLPTVGGKDAEIDIARAEEMFDYALKCGINYFDTAWPYHGGKSEEVTGDILAAYPRDSWNIASKFPGWSRENIEKRTEIFTTQLKRCRVDRFDFYLFHCVSDSNIEGYLDPSLGLADYIFEQKREGRIGHVGFSVHASTETTRRFLDAYGEHIDFCQIQLNYLDHTYQKANEKLDMLKERGIPVWVMEPLRGGKLASLSESYRAMLAPYREISPAEWAFRYIQSIPEVTMTLSGMSDMSQLKDNIRIFSEHRPLGETEKSVLSEIAADMSQKFIPCTGCKYCIDKCPLELNIPYLLNLYNEHTFTGGEFTTPPVLKKAKPERRPSACLACRSCESVCPQQIRISEILGDFAKKMAK